MAEKRKQSQDLKKLMDEYFLKALTLEDKDDKHQAFYHAVSLSEKIGKSNNFRIWIEPESKELDNDGDEIRKFYLVC